MKVAMVAALVVTAAVVVATAGAALAGAASLGSAFSGAMLGVGTALGVSGSVMTGILMATAALDLGMLASVLPKPSTGGSQTKWKADPYAGFPYSMGRTFSAGNIVAKLLKGANNTFMGVVTVLSIGPIDGFETSFMNKTTMVWDGTGQLGGGQATGTYHGYIWEDRQIGACPEAQRVGTVALADFPGWDDTYKLSGLATVANAFAYDAKSTNGLTSLPGPGWIHRGVHVYDPRLDSTYPGGSGSCRALDETTYVYSENPHLHALTWALGRWHNGVRVAGIGAPIDLIDVASFVEGANLCDARDWKVGGQVYTRPDTMWNALKSMLQAGGATPALPGGIIACINKAPRATLATITHRDIIGKCSFSGTQSRRTRINGIIPQYRSEANDWELVSAQEISVADYQTLDGGERTKEISYPLVQDVDQVAALARYDIEDSREAGPGTISLKPAWMNYKLGDCVMFQPQDGWSVKVMITGRKIDPATGGVTYTVRSETDAKHAFALGQTGVAPPTAGLTYSNDVAAPSLDWTLTGATLTASDGTTMPALELAGAVSNPNADAVVIEYRPYVSTAGDDDNWASASIDAPTITRKDITAVTSGAEYQASVRYRVRGTLGSRAIFGPVPAGAMSINGGTLQDATVDTAQLASGAVTGSVRVLPASSFNGTGSYVEIASMSLVLTDSAQVDLMANAQQGYASGARDWGLKLLVDGTVVKEFSYGGGRAGLTDILTMIRNGVSLAAGTHTLSLQWVGADSSVGVSTIDMSAIRRSA